MASNGYVRAECSGCIFYDYDREYGCYCTLRKEGFESDGMSWISANDCDRNPELRMKHYELCEHRVGEKDVKNIIREYFGIEKVEYKY